MKPRTIKKTLPEAPNCNVVKLDDATITRAVCVQLIISTAVSFRSVPKILQSMGAFYGAPSWVPHFSSVINWTQRVGLALLKQVVPIQEPWLAIIDHSIDIGVKQAFVVLRVRCDVLAERGAAIRLEDCECIGLRIRESTDGETVCEDLKDIFKQSGDPVGFIKDNGSGLSRGIRLWNEEAAKPAEIIDDVGHVMANALKAEFDKTDDFVLFRQTITTGAARLRQTALAFLIPPKIRTKGRFQGIGRLATWARQILRVLHAGGNDPQGDALEKLHQALPDFLQQQPFIERFARTIDVIHQFWKSVKNEGLNKKTYEEGHQLALALPNNSTVRDKLIQWLDDHWAIYQRMELGEAGMPVSSDIIESLFGKFKYMTERSPSAEMNRLALVIPVFCGIAPTPLELGSHFSTCRQKDLVAWENKNISHTLRKRRKAFMDNPSTDMIDFNGAKSRE